MPNRAFPRSSRYGTRRRINGKQTTGSRTALAEQEPPLSAEEEIERAQPPDDDLGNLGEKSMEELLALTEEKGIKTPPKRRSELVMTLLAVYAREADLLVGAGMIEIMNEGYGFLRPTNRQDKVEDIYVSRNVVKAYGLRKYDVVAGRIRPPGSSGRYYSLERPELVNSISPKEAAKRPRFEKLTATYPDERIKLETTPKQLAPRIIDIAAPIGRGQRALIVAPPKAGKTIILKQIAAAISKNHPEICLLVALIGERPEEVTDIRRSVDGEIYSSTFDEPAEYHAKVSETALERARRLVESGEDVVLLLDSLTRLARAYNVTAPSSGKTLSGGMDTAALYPPKMFFGAARNCEEGGSLTIIATALIETGSRLDDVIYEEFKGTGNMELHLDRSLAERRVFPAIDVEKSGTRHEEMLLDAKTLRQVWMLRRMIALLGQSSTGSTESAERIIERMAKTRTNKEFLASIASPEKS